MTDLTRWQRMRISAGTLDCAIGDLVFYEVPDWLLNRAFEIPCSEDGSSILAIREGRSTERAVRVKEAWRPYVELSTGLLDYECRGQGLIQWASLGVDNHTWLPYSQIEVALDPDDLDGVYY